MSEYSTAGSWIGSVGSATMMVSAEMVNNIDLQKIALICSIAAAGATFVFTVIKAIRYLVSAAKDGKITEEEAKQIKQNADDIISGIETIKTTTIDKEDK